MPDLLTHTLFVYPLKFKVKKFTPIILLGAVLPDILSRIPSVLFPFQSKIRWAQAALHTPMALLLICLLVSLFFQEKLRINIFKYLFIGSSTHFLLDLLQKSLTTGCFLFFPFSFDSFSFSLIWPNDIVLLIFPLLVLNLLLYVRNFWYHQQK